MNRLLNKLMLAFECWLESFIRTEYEKYKEEEQQNDVREDEDVERLTRESVAVLIREILVEDEVLTTDNMAETEEVDDADRVVSKKLLDAEFDELRDEIRNASINIDFY